jgi:phosphotransferase system enzyme I (PtsP)
MIATSAGRRAMEAGSSKTYLAARGHKLPEPLKIGVMIEIPSLLWQLDNLLPLVDFASVPMISCSSCSPRPRQSQTCRAL